MTKKNKAFKAALQEAAESISYFWEIQWDEDVFKDDVKRNRLDFGMTEREAVLAAAKRQVESHGETMKSQVDWQILQGLNALRTLELPETSSEPRELLGHVVRSYRSAPPENSERIPGPPDPPKGPSPREWG